jgi:hydrogenase/urease accessory protein HupE
MILRFLLLVVLLAPLVAERAGAHALEPGFLEVQALGGDEWRVTWRKPQVGGAPMAIDAVLPEGCDPRRGPAPTFDGRAFLAGWITTCPGGLAGGQIRIEGLEATRTDVLVRYDLGDGQPPTATRMTAASPAFTVPDVQGTLAVFGSYFVLGVDHILKGIDHLLFVLMLLLLIRDWHTLLGAVTAFTVAHSLSLAAASLGWIVVPAPPVEAIVALSIAFLAAELLHPPGEEKRLTERFPWLVAFAFGLLHGLGFARALLEIGLPAGDVPLALLAFNLGVEAGQILFIAMVLALGTALSQLYPVRPGCFRPWIDGSAGGRLRGGHAHRLLGGPAGGGVCRMTRHWIILPAVIVPSPALAHDAFGDLGPFYASFLHPLADPLQAVLLIGTARLSCRTADRHRARGVAGFRRGSGTGAMAWLASGAHASATPARGCCRGRGSFCHAARALEGPLGRASPLLPSPARLPASPPVGRIARRCNPSSEGSSGSEYSPRLPGWGSTRWRGASRPSRPQSPVLGSLPSACSQVRFQSNKKHIISTDDQHRQKGP